MAKYNDRKAQKLKIESLKLLCEIRNSLSENISIKTFSLLVVM